MSQSLDYDAFAHAVQTAVGISFRVDLQPAGGFSQKVYPPTYLKHKSDNNQEHEYAKEHRTLDGIPVEAVLLDSIPSQANRLEESLAIMAPALNLPIVSMVLEGTRITSLNAPHRAVDIYFLDSQVGDPQNHPKPFLESDFGKQMVQATPRNATHLFRYVPTALLFGMWASHATGISNRDNRFARTLASEIFGWSTTALTPGIKTASRLDPFNLRSDIDIYPSPSPIERWTTTTPDEKAVPIKLSKKGLGNVAPTIDPMGGFTVEGIRQQATLSFLGLRHWHFPLDGELESDPIRDAAAHTVLALLGLIALFRQFNAGYGLRSGCDLQPLTEPTITLLGRTVQDNQDFPIDESALTLGLHQALENVEHYGLAWATPADMPELTPSAKLIELVTNTQNVADDNQE